MTISLTPENEAELRNRASQQGCDLDSLVNNMIQSMLQWDIQEREETIAALKDGLKAIEEGRERSFKDFMREHHDRWPDTHA